MLENMCGVALKRFPITEIGDLRAAIYDWRRPQQVPAAQDAWPAARIGMDEKESNQRITLTLSRSADPDLRRQIHEQIKAFNDAVSPAHRQTRGKGITPLNIAAHDAQDRLIGGLSAATYWGWLDIEDFWLHESYRRQGLGTSILAAAEKEARQRGCRRAKLETFSFQAREFYEKNGYKVVGRLNEYPPGESFYWMVKELTG
jgi:GNAT superfamily N-acetyltransferase